jgi:NADPH:quinone reductase-like Zn-dependent oxidoreductase
VSVRELWFTGPRAVEVRGVPRRPLCDGELRLRGLVSGVSQGTELLLFKGEGPTPFDPSLDAPGAPTYPRRYGYAWVGEVTESASATHPVGARVFALLPHGDEHCVEASRARVLPADLPAERAVLAANLETAVNCVWDAGVVLGDDVVVIGGGIVGLLAGFAARRGGASRVRLVEPSAERRRAALELGFEAASALVPREGATADVVIEASGDPTCLDVAIGLARDEGTIAVASFYGARVAPVALGADFHRRRLTLRSSQVSRLPALRAPRWTFDRRFALVTELLKDAALDGLLEPKTPFDEAPATYARLASSPGAALQTLFGYAGRGC